MKLILILLLIPCMMGCNSKKEENKGVWISLEQWQQIQIDRISRAVDTMSWKISVEPKWPYNSLMSRGWPKDKLFIYVKIKQ